MLMNPTLKMSQIAAHFCVTPSWLSTIVHSDAFQDQLARRGDEMFEVGVVQELGSKITGAAHMAIEEYIDKIPTLTSDQLINSTDKLLGRLGYGSSGGMGGINIGDGATVQINGNQVAPDIVARAREKIGAKVNGKNEVGSGDSQSALQNDEQAEVFIEAQGTSLREESELSFDGEVRDNELHSESMVQISATRGQD